MPGGWRARDTLVGFRTPGYTNRRLWSTDAACQLPFVPINIWGHVHVIVRYPSTVPPPETETAAPGVPEPLSVDPSDGAGPTRYQYLVHSQCHDPLPTAPAQKKKKSPEEKPAYVPILAKHSTNPESSPKAQRTLQNKSKQRHGVRAGKRRHSGSADQILCRPPVLVLRIRAPYWCSCR